MNLKSFNNLNIETERKYIIATFGLLVAIFSLYIYLVSHSVVHVVIRKEVQQEINKLHTEISHLEAEYIMAQHSVSSEIASLDGYVEVRQKIFIDRNNDDSKLVLSTDLDR
jgi:hypothetical protein